MFRKFQQWTSSEVGTKVLHTLGALSCAAGAAPYLIPQGLFLDKFVEHYQLYKNGFPVKIPKSLEDKGQQVLQETSLDSKHKDAIRFFNVYGFDVYHLGTTNTKYGAAIGIPKTYNYKSTEEVERNDIQVDHKNIPWSSEAADSLLESLVLSDNAQKFAIAKEIYRVTYPTLYIHGIGTAAVMFITLQLSIWGNKRLRFLQRPLKQRAIWYSLTCFFGWALWITLTDMSNVYLDGECDKAAADMGKDYTSGGIEYYQKKMQQNRALRTLMGTRGENFYTAHGNYSTLFRTKALPLSQRLDDLKKRQTETEEKES